MRPDILPCIVAPPQECLVAGSFVHIEKTDDSFGLYPPVTVRIDAFRLRIVFVDQTSVGSQSLDGRGCQCLDHGTDICRNLRFSEYEGGFVDEPRCLDVMPVRDLPSLWLPPCIEKEIQVPRLRIEKPVGMDVNQFPDRRRNPIFTPDPQQVRVRFEQVQVRIHAEVGVGILLAQTHVFQRLPVPGQCFDVSALHCIPDMLLKRSEQSGGFVQRLRITRRPDIFAQSVNCETDSIALFLAADRTSVGSYLPVDPTMYRVDQPESQKLPELAGCVQVFRPSGHSVSCREGPQHPRDQDCALPGFGMRFSAAVDTSREMHPVAQKCHPERQDVAGQFLRQLLPPLYKHLFHHSFVFRRRLSSVVIRSIRFSPSG